MRAKKIGTFACEVRVTSGDFRSDTAFDNPWVDAFMPNANADRRAPVVLC